MEPVYAIYVAIDKNGTEAIFEGKPRRDNRTHVWCTASCYHSCILLPHGTIRKLIGRDLTWSDEPVLLKGTVESAETVKSPQKEDCKFWTECLCMKRTMCILGYGECPDFTPKNN